MKQISPLFLLVFLLFSCSGKTNETDSQKTSTSENTEFIQKQEIPSEAQEIIPPQSQEENLSYPNSIDLKWLEEDYQVPPWGGATDVTLIPEYIYTKLYWETTKNDWPTIEELLDKYDLEYDEINAVNLNYAGMEAYDREEYLDAIALFRWGTLKDPSYVYPHYNLACSASLLLEEILSKDPSSLNLDLYYNKYGVYYAIPFMMLDEIFSHLTISLFLERDYIDKIIKDGDLTILHSMNRFENFIHYLNSGKIWSYYGFSSLDYLSSERTESIKFSIFLDGRCYRPHIIKYYQESGSFLSPSLNLILSDFNVNNNSSKLCTSEINDYKSMWKELVRNIGFLPQWDDVFESISHSFNFQEHTYISSIDESITTSSIFSKRLPNSTNEGFGELIGFTCHINYLPLPVEITSSSLSFSNGKVIKKINAKQWLDELGKQGENNG